MSPFSYDADAAGNRFIGRVIFAREMTAAEFDQRRNATLSAKMGADAPVFYLEVENLESKTPGTTRSTFFTAETAPVSKWMRFLKALKELSVSIKRNPDGTTDLEGKYFVADEKEVKVGKYGTMNTIEMVAIPPPEDIEALEQARAQMMGAPSGVPAASKDQTAEAILGMVDGLTEEQLGEQMKALGFTGWDGVLAELKAKQSILTGPDGKLKVA